jgi:hypothetical protein
MKKITQFYHHWTQFSYLMALSSYETKICARCITSNYKITRFNTSSTASKSYSTYYTKGKVPWN